MCLFLGSWTLPPSSKSAIWHLYLRVFWNDEAAGVAQIGRVATLEHGKGIGGEILHAGVEVARDRLGAKKITLHAQEYAIGYYAKEGFEVVSDIFMEDGIPHVTMELAVML